MYIYTGTKFSCEGAQFQTMASQGSSQRNQNMNRVCDEIHVVAIVEKCGDPYIVEENPHIHDPDDVFPGEVIRINHFNKR
ncbi:hypothetical protein MLD38_018559 [Melastoma candidum]|uniref:Uncharacterized protein n=1 Tax=Melastoma candidum TaxID=119954 RepID=A0ACB9QU52_9MYRT|nr:hypothetical protein MLD38_018559 [Melastoma candidum]